MLNKQTIKQQIIDDVCQMIFIGTLKRGDFLPSIRLMSDRYKVSRGTVMLVYKSLESLGYIQGHERSGYLVTGTPELTEPVTPAVTEYLADHREPESVEKKNAATRVYQWLEHHYRMQLPRHFIRRWCLNNSSARQPAGWVHSDVSDRQLRKSLCRFIRLSRGISLQPDNLLMLSGIQEALLLIGTTLASTRQQVTVLVEDPCPPNVRELFQCLNFQVIPIAVDDQGMRVEDFPLQGADLILTSPALQFPTGSSLSAVRRRKLRQWATRHDALIIENDSFAMLGFGQSVIPALSQHYPDPQVIYLTHLAELTGNGMNICCITAPLPFMQLMQHFLPLLISETNPLTRALLSAFLDSAHFMKYLTASLQTRQQKSALAQEGIALWAPEIRCCGMKNAGFLTFRAEIRQVPEELLNQSFFLLDSFRHTPQETGQKQQSILYPFGLLSISDIGKINQQLRLSVLAGR